MSYYFSEEQIFKTKLLIPKEEEPEQNHVSGAYIASSIISKINPNDIRLKDDVLIICDNALEKALDYCNDDVCAKVADEVKQEVLKLFGVDAEVEFFIAYVREEEPDPIPPMYWGETETVYYYSLSIKAKL